MCMRLALSIFTALLGGLVRAADALPSRPSGAASDLLSIVRFTYLRTTTIQLRDGSDREVISVEGSYVFHPTFKVNYDANYWRTDVTGSDQTGWADSRIRPIYFPRTQRWRSLVYRTAVGMDLRLDAGNADKGIGSGAHQFGVLAGLQLLFSRQTRMSIVGEHRKAFASEPGYDLEQTVLGVVGVHTFPTLKSWVATELIFVVNHEGDDTSTTTFKFQLGRSFTKTLGVHMDAVFPVAGRDFIDHAIRLTLRIQY